MGPGFTSMGPGPSRQLRAPYYCWSESFCACCRACWQRWPAEAPAVVALPDASQLGRNVGLGANQALSAIPESNTKVAKFGIMGIVAENGPLGGQ